jgi:pilus retraction protein PilT
MSFFDLPPIIERMLLVSDKISDLNFSVGQLPQVEINGKLTPVQPLGLQKLTPYQTEIIAMTLLRENQEAAERLVKTGTADLSYALPSRARFRCNIFQQRGVYSIVMRVIPTDIPTLSTLYLPPQLADIAELRNGLVLITGPTGSGKSSTLAAVIDIINETKHYHVVAIEDPIEYLHTHKSSTINQREVGHDTKDFPSALRAALRQAPKVILIGEMRDYETAESGIQASLTGHLVFSTLHTNDAPSSFTRLIAMGVEPFLVASTVEGVMAQRLIRTICPDCKAAYHPEHADLPSDFPVPEGNGQRLTLWRGMGCRSCRQTGFRGRTGIHELMVTGDELREMVVQRLNAGAIRQEAVKRGMLTLRQDGWRKVLQGITTTDEIARVTAGDIIF